MEIQKKRFFNGLLIVLAILSVFIYAKIFLFPDNLFQIVEAQFAPIVYLESPPPGSTLSGRYNFDVNMMPNDPVTSLMVRVLSGTQDVGELPCSLTRHSDGHWRGPCDTLFIPPHLQSVCFEIQAYGVDGRIDLQGGDCGQARFGPFSINNSFTMTQPVPNSEVSGTVALGASLSGDASSASFEIVGANPDQPSQQLTARHDSGNQGGSTWSATWGTSSVPNGDYTIHFSFVTLGGTAMTDVASVVVHVVNQACVPNWQCGSWSDCSTVGTQTRTCTDGCGNSRTEEQTCTYEPPANHNANTNTPPPNSNTNTNAPPVNRNANVNTEPLTAPTITSPTAHQEFRTAYPTVTGQADSRYELRIYVDNTLDGTTQPASSGTFSYQLANSLHAGQHEVFAVSVAGNRTSLESAHVPFAVLPPRLVMTIPKEGETVVGSITLTALVEGEIGTLDFRWDAEAGDSRTNTNVLIGAGRPVENRPDVWERSWNTAETPNGRYFLYASATDEAGDTYWSNKVSITIDHQLNIENPPPSSPPPAEPSITTLVNDPQTIETLTDEQDIDQLVADLVEGGQVSQASAEAVKAQFRKIVFEEPTRKGTLNKKDLKVVMVENFSPKIGQNTIIIKGIGPKNAYLTLFIYSSPLVVTTKTDASGNFTYVLDKNLADGKHEVYVTVTDETGKIKEKSSPFAFFVRRAQAVSEEDYLRGDVNVQGESVALINNYLTVAIVIIAVVLALLAGAYVLSRRKSKAT